jgi:NADH-quinone oxidoreductase subunit E
MAKAKQSVRAGGSSSGGSKAGGSTAAVRTKAADVICGPDQPPEGVLNRVSERLGIPVAKVSHVVESVGEAADRDAEIDRIVSEYKGEKGALIQILLEIQRESRWLPREVLKSVCEKLGVPLSQAYRIATFYKAFSLTPQGRHRVAVCLGTACHVRGAPRLLDRVEDATNIKPGETSQDDRFTLETVNCLGCCALGPVVVVDDDYHSNPSAAELDKILAGCD